MDTKFKDILLKCDMFGTPITFRHNSHTKYKSLIGGIATLICSGLIIFLLNYFASDCIYKTNPIVRDVNVYNVDNYINLTNYFWAFYFTDEKY
jgi:hypothetical protein